VSFTEGKLEEYDLTPQTFVQIDAIEGCKMFVEAENLL